jgi:FixJ family two-component response regulator
MNSSCQDNLSTIEQSTTETGLVSVVDDDPSVVEAIVGLMESLGYKAVGVSSAEEFLMSPWLFRTIHEQM